MKNYVLMGMKHCGKSTLGRRLAREWGWDFYDLDDLLVQENPQGAVLTPREIDRQLGNATFRLWETRALEKLLTGRAKREKPWVLALGGGAIANPGARDLLEEIENRVYLKVDEETLFQRIIPGGIPSFLDPQRPRESFHEIYLTRTALYEEWARLTVSLEGLDLAGAFGHLKKHLQGV